MSETNETENLFKSVKEKLQSGAAFYHHNCSLCGVSTLFTANKATYFLDRHAVVPGIQIGRNHGMHLNIGISTLKTVGLKS